MKIEFFMCGKWVHNMRKPVISSEISPKFDGVPNTDTLPEVQLSNLLKLLQI